MDAKIIKFIQKKEVVLEHVLIQNSNNVEMFLYKFIIPNIVDWEKMEHGLVLLSIVKLVQILIPTLSISELL